MDCRDIIMSEEYADFIVEAYENKIQNKRNNIDECATFPGFDYAFTYKPLSEIVGNGLSAYTYGEIPNLYGLMDLVAVESTGALKLQNLPGLNLDGKGIAIGIIDDGIDAYHEAFRYSNGNTRIIRAWNQEDQTLDTPFYFNYGSELSLELINEELKKDSSEILDNMKRDSAHGTFVTGIAAGNNNTDKGFASPANSADLIIVKLKQAKKYLKEYYMIDEGAKAYQENDIISAIAYILQVANGNHTPVIICLPLGSNQGAHSGYSIVGNFMSSYAIRTGVGIVCANGNEGNSRHHCSGRITDVNGFEDVQIRVEGNKNGFSLELWAETPDIFEIEITSPTGERIPRVNSSLRQEQVYRLLFERTTVYVKYELVERLSGSELIQVRFDNPTEGVWNIRVFGELIVCGKYNMWLPITEFVGEETYFLKPDPNITLTTPSDTFAPISVGAYNNATEGLYINSGRGYTVNNIVKPNFVAPGVNVLGPTLNNGYTRMSGTSVAAGITTGVMAQVMEWGLIQGNRIDMNTTEIKSYLMRGARRKSTLTYPNEQWGYGELDAYNSIDILRV